MRNSVCEFHVTWSSYRYILVLFLSFFSSSSAWIRCLENCATLLLNTVSFSLFIRFLFGVIVWGRCYHFSLWLRRNSARFSYFPSHPLFVIFFFHSLANSLFLTLLVLRASSFVAFLSLQFVFCVEREKEPSTVFVLAQYHVALTRRNRLHRTLYGQMALGL